MMSLKQWLAEEAQRTKRSPHAIYNRIQRGHYPGLKFVRNNRRVSFVHPDSDGTYIATLPEQQPLKDVYREVIRLRRENARLRDVLNKIHHASRGIKSVDKTLQVGQKEGT